MKVCCKLQQVLSASQQAGHKPACTAANLHKSSITHCFLSLSIDSLWAVQHGLLPLGRLVHQAEAAMSLVQRFASNLKGLKLKELPGYTSKFAKENLQPEQIRWVQDLVVRSSHHPTGCSCLC